MSGDPLATARPSNDATLRAESLSMRFGGLRVFDDISLSMAPGDVLGVIGPNGAGKTTLINVLSGMLLPSSGEIYIGSRRITGLPLHAMSRLGVVRSFQQTNIFRTAMVRQNLTRALRFGGVRASSWHRLESLLERFDLVRRLDEQSDKLPYGQQKMLGLMLAYAVSPRVLLLDEPAAGLEGRERIQIDAFVEQARADLGCSVMVVEHDMDMVRRLCPRVIVLDAGSVIADGQPSDVLSRREVIDAYIGAVDEQTTQC